MWKLISPKEEWKWSFLDGYYVFKNVVYLMERNDIYKYKLIDENGNKFDYDLIKCLVKY